MIDQDSAEFTEAFVSAVRPGEPRGRPLWWMAMIAIGVVFAAALASLLNGAFGGGSGSTAVPSTASTWTAVAGPSCASSGTSFTKVGYYMGTSQKAADWAVSRTGGYAGGGCAGGFVSVPLSGHAQAYDSNRYALWTFRLGLSLEKSASCLLSTYVPSDEALSAVGGAPAQYYYYATAYVAGSAAKAAGGYAVNQVKDRGEWVSNSSFPVTGGQVSVRMVDTGIPRGARAAAAQVRLTCSAK
jgi:hypothetical protein